MRRIVDSLILVLVAYSVCWPVARSLMGTAPTTRAEVVSVTIADCAVVPSAKVKIARSKSDAAADRFVAEGVQRAGAAGVGLQLTGPIDITWIIVELPGRSLPPRRIALGEGDGPVEFEVRDDLPVVIGEAPATNRRIRVTLRTSTGTEAFDVPCDAQGHFVFVLPPDGLNAESIAFDTERGQRLDEREPPRTTGVHDLGRL